MERVEAAVWPKLGVAANNAAIAAPQTSVFLPKPDRSLFIVAPTGSRPIAA